MIVSRFAVGVLLIFNTILAVSVINLEFFAKQGKRFTADDGAQERRERMAADQELMARIDALRCDTAAPQ
jgi:hypothetical protein